MTTRVLPESSKSIAKRTVIDMHAMQASGDTIAQLARRVSQVYKTHTGLTCQMLKVLSAALMWVRVSGVKAANWVTCLKLYTSSTASGLHPTRAQFVEASTMRVTT